MQTYLSRPFVEIFVGSGFGCLDVFLDARIADSPTIFITKPSCTGPRHMTPVAPKLHGSTEPSDHNIPSSGIPQRSEQRSE